MLESLLAFDAIARPRYCLQALKGDLLAAYHAFAEAFLIQTRERTKEMLKQLAILAGFFQQHFLLVASGGAVHGVGKRYFGGGQLGLGVLQGFPDVFNAALQSRAQTRSLISGHEDWTVVEKVKARPRRSAPGVTLLLVGVGTALAVTLAHALFHALLMLLGHCVELLLLIRIEHLADLARGGLMQFDHLGAAVLLRKRTLLPQGLELLLLVLENGFNLGLLVGGEVERLGHVLQAAIDALLTVPTMVVVLTRGLILVAFLSAWLVLR